MHNKKFSVCFILNLFIMKTFLLAVMFLFVAVGVQAQTNPEKIIEEFFQNYQQGEAVVALDKLYSHMAMSWSDRIKDDLDKIKSQFAGLQSIVGQYYGNKLLAHKELAGTYSIYSYIVKFDRQPVRFVFQFYKPQDTWYLYGFSYDDSITDELKEAVKVYNL